jgi:hypothetical protein
MSITDSTLSKINNIHSIISSDVNDRGMKHLICDGDFLESTILFARIPTSQESPTLVILSGFPCLVSYDPPTETDGPNGALALALCGVALGYRVIIVTDDCNRSVFEKGLEALLSSCAEVFNGKEEMIVLKSFPDESKMSSYQEQELQDLAEANLIIACERAGPSKDGKCYTMRGIDMNSHGLIAPLHTIVDIARRRGTKFIGIGDGGNELGMGKVIDAVKQHIPLGDQIGCVVAADYLVAASVSNWGAYALCGAAALVKANDFSDNDTRDLKEWISKCLPTEDADLYILKECMKAGCRDGINQRLDEPYVDGMPAERSLECLRDIWNAALN